MSSEILIDTPGAGRKGTERDAGRTEREASAERQELQPWQFFVLAGLACATALVFLVRSQGVTIVVLSAVMIGTMVLVGIAALRTFRPLVSADDDRTAMIGQRTRVALEREKLLVLRTIKELEFDRAMGKLAERDWHEMSTRLRARAARLIHQLDAGAGYRERIERDLAARIGAPAEAAPVTERVCGGCRTENDPDAKFCKACGARL